MLNIIVKKDRHFGSTSYAPGCKISGADQGTFGTNENFGVKTGNVANFFRWASTKAQTCLRSSVLRDASHAWISVSNFQELLSLVKLIKRPRYSRLTYGQAIRRSALRAISMAHLGHRIY